MKCCPTHSGVDPPCQEPFLGPRPRGLERPRETSDAASATALHLPSKVSSVVHGDPEDLSSQAPGRLGKTAKAAKVECHVEQNFRYQTLQPKPVPTC